MIYSISNYKITGSNSLSYNTFRFMYMAKHTDCNVIQDRWLTLSVNKMNRSLSTNSQ